MKQNAINTNELWRYRLPIEDKLWDLFFNDKFYKENVNEIEEFYDFPFERKCENLKRRFRDITGKTKETKLIQELHDKYGIKSEVCLFAGEKEQLKEPVSIIHYGNNSIYFISYQVLSGCLEQELLPLFAQKFGNLFFSTPATIPIDFLTEKLEEQSMEVYNEDIYRLLILSLRLGHVNEYHADRFAILATGSFEAVVRSYLKGERMHGHNIQDPDLIRLIKNYPKRKKIAIRKYLHGCQPEPIDRIYAMFLFSLEHGFLENESLNKIKPKVRFDEILNYSQIVREYRGLI